MFTNVLLKGDQGLPGEIGAPGERGAGEPGAKVSLLHFSNKSTINMKTFVFFMHIKVCSCLLQRIYIYAPLLMILILNYCLYTCVGGTWSSRVIRITRFTWGRWSSRTEGTNLTLITKTFYLLSINTSEKVTLIFVSLCVFQGEPGVSGLRGPEGAAGMGIQGEKVSLSLFLNVYLSKIILTL